MQIDTSSLLSGASPFAASPMANVATGAASQTGAAANPNDPSTTNALASTDPLANENTFLQLLVAQIKNQDPTQPIDSTTFLTQLAQFSQLEQLIGIRQDVQSLDNAAGSTPPASTTNGTTNS